MPRIVRTAISGLEPVYVGLEPSAVFPGMPQTYRATEEGTGLLLALVSKAQGKGWFVMPEPALGAEEQRYTHVPTLFGAAQVIGHARARVLRGSRLSEV